MTTSSRTRNPKNSPQPRRDHLPELPADWILLEWHAVAFDHGGRQTLRGQKSLQAALDVVPRRARIRPGGYFEPHPKSLRSSLNDLELVHVCLLLNDGGKSKRQELHRSPIWGAKTHD